MILFPLSLFLSSSARFIRFLLLAEVFSILNDTGYLLLIILIGDDFWSFIPAVCCNILMIDYAKVFSHYESFKILLQK